MQIDTGTELLRARVDGPIARLTFNDPARHNVLALAMQEAIPGVVEAWEADPAVRVIVIEGAGGRAFVAGADISEFGARRTAPQDRADYDKRSGAAWRVWRHVTKPVIAKIDGYCIGGGLLMALQADIRICSEPSTFAVPGRPPGPRLRLRWRPPDDESRQPGDRLRDPVLGTALLVGRGAQRRARQPRGRGRRAGGCGGRAGRADRARTRR